ncbi:uncharacterized protein A1O9_03114 [Exophiala aquamarina CBS 119918]|uniref:F-box domain-containing protein n=1 Tax=Exophiala aquamarina CBS 119918 TaxID=1182545 RepID=A0A072PP69_9EURO|nr:uncharacterized protein A1O9_03114 [Exophiala aquamarina CBS 119918]KEF61547.1 hypothetical protein A1O9_03114 [Exophiala aquamarina CBS 119918]
MPGNPGHPLSLPLPIRAATPGKLLMIEAAPEYLEDEKDPVHPPSIFDFPRELIELIQSRLTYHDLKALRATCKASKEAILLDDVKIAQTRLKATLLLQEAADYTQRQQKIAEFSRWARRWPNEYRTYWSSDTISNIHKNYITRATRLNCYVCLRSLPRECFADRQATGARSLGHKEAKMRFCTNCGTKRSIWPPGTVLKIVHKSYVACRGCCSIQKGEVFYRSLGVCSKECQELIEKIQQSAADLEVKPAHSTAESHSHDVRREVNHTTGASDTATARMRATRCLRCWGIDHTEKTADGALGMRLCKKCETFKFGDMCAGPEVASDARTDYGR